MIKTENCKENYKHGKKETDLDQEPPCKQNGYTFLD
jgi:hypothetical protein